VAPGASGSATPAAGNPLTVPVSSSSGKSASSSREARSTLPTTLALILTASPSETSTLPDLDLILVSDVTCTGTVVAGTPNVNTMVTGAAPPGRGRVTLLPGTSANPLSLISESSARTGAAPINTTRSESVETVRIHRCHMAERSSLL